LVVITRDRILDKIKQGSVLLHPYHRYVSDTPWIRTMRRLCRRPLFVFYSNITKQYVVAEWIIVPRHFGRTLGVCTELMSISAHPGQWPADLPDLKRMKERTQPAIPFLLAIGKRAAEKRRKERAILMSTEEERRDVAKHYRRKGKDDLSDSIMQGPFIGKEEGGQELEQLTNDLITMSKGLD
jgi:hypothetical protein